MMGRKKSLCNIMGEKIELGKRAPLKDAKIHASIREEKVLIGIHFRQS